MNMALVNNYDKHIHLTASVGFTFSCFDIAILCVLFRIIMQLYILFLSSN